MAHRWPGNIRELKNVIERLVLKANGQVISPNGAAVGCLHASHRRDWSPPAAPAAGADRQRRPVADELATRMLRAPRKSSGRSSIRSSCRAI